MLDLNRQKADQRALTLGTSRLLQADGQQALELVDDQLDDFLQDFPRSLPWSDIPIDLSTLPSVELLEPQSAHGIHDVFGDGLPINA